MKRYNLIYEIIFKDSKNLFTSESVELASVDLFGAIQEASVIVHKLKENYGEAFEVKSWVK